MLTLKQIRKLGGATPADKQLIKDRNVVTNEKDWAPNDAHMIIYNETPDKDLLKLAKLQIDSPKFFQEYLHDAEQATEQVYPIRIYHCGKTRVEFSNGEKVQAKLLLAACKDKRTNNPTFWACKSRGLQIIVVKSNDRVKVLIATLQPTHHEEIDWELKNEELPKSAKTQQGSKTGRKN